MSASFRRQSRTWFHYAAFLDAADHFWGWAFWEAAFNGRTITREMERQVGLI